jgi:hypothetical protein
MWPVADPGETFDASTVGEILCPVDRLPVAIHPALTACEWSAPLAVDYRGPDALEAAGEDAAAALEILPPDGSGVYTEAAAVYRYAEGGDVPALPICGACLVDAGDAVDTRAVGARTAARCALCEIDGAAARWSEANRGAAIWRALVVGFEPERARHGRPGIRSPRWAERDARDGAAWARIAALRSARG